MKFVTVKNRWKSYLEIRENAKYDKMPSTLLYLVLAIVSSTFYPTHPNLASNSDANANTARNTRNIFAVCGTVFCSLSVFSKALFNFTVNNIHITIDYFHLTA